MDSYYTRIGGFFQYFPRERGFRRYFNELIKLIKSERRLLLVSGWLAAGTYFLQWLVGLRPPALYLQKIGSGSKPA